MTTLADKAILSGADNHPPMLEKNMYDSWKSIMELYMINRQHGRMILESVENGLLIWPTIEENGVTRPKKYFDLAATEAIQADCDIKAKNIILQGLPPEIYALVSNHKVAKELWERIQLLMLGTSLTKQERECKLYDEFNKFAYKKGETLLNTKFLNTLPPEWSKFVTDVKLVRDLHTTNIDQLHAYLGQHKFHANEVRLMHERNSDPLALVATHQMTQSPYQTHQNSYQNSQFQPQVSLYQSPLHVHHNVYSLSSSIPQLEYAPTVNQRPEFPQLDSGLIVLVFQKGDDPIDAINHMMSFLTVVVTARYPTTLGNKLPLMMVELPYNQFRGDKLLLLRVLQGPTLQEQVEAILGNKGLLYVTTAKGKDTCSLEDSKRSKLKDLHNLESKYKKSPRIGTERMIFNIDSAMKHSYSNDDTCFSIDVIDEILEEDFDALLDEDAWLRKEGNAPKRSRTTNLSKGTLLEEEIFAEFDEFMAMTADENYDFKSDTEDPPFKKITINTDYKIKTSIEEPPMDLKLKPLPNNLEYVFLEYTLISSVNISSQLSKEKKNRLISVLKKHKQAFAWKTTDIPGICLSFCKHKIQLLDDKKLVVQKQRRLSPNMQEVVKKEIKNSWIYV
ncbi:hypothetical protein Tco_0861070 [Tanacetum coccineum]|uniref:Reverse transcriptase domain-containing protein n=1 Tax=Tanacetum coccineum TaxID=301880 RepID=A0ABQ5BKH0_9ASTR